MKSTDFDCHKKCVSNMFLLEKILDNEDGNVVSLLFLRSLHQMSQCHVIVHWHEMSAVSANINFGLYSVKSVRSWILLFFKILVQKEKKHQSIQKPRHCGACL